MRRLTSIAAMLIVLATMMPMLACAATPRMTRTEADCCKQMRARCGEIAKQGCCRVEVRNDLTILPSHVVAAPVLAHQTVAFVKPLLVDLSSSAASSWHVPDDHAPPGFLIATTTVLRI